jgi:hypothetical protein
MAYIESHQSLSRHRKTLAVVSTLHVDRHKLLGHLHELWWWGLDNADITGLVGHVSDEVLAEAAGWPLKDAQRFVGALTSAEFIDATPDGLVLHDWPDYAGKLNERREQNRERMRRARAARGPRTDPPNGRARAEHVQHTNGAQAAHVDNTFDARAPATVPEQSLTERTLSPHPTGGPPQLRIVGEPVPKPTHKPIDDEYLNEMTAEFAPKLGGQQHVRLEIDRALNHRQYTKAIDKRKYLRNWLSRDVEFAQSRIAAGGGAPYRKALTAEQLEDLPF